VSTPRRIRVVSSAMPVLMTRWHRAGGAASRAAGRCPDRAAGCRIEVIATGEQYTPPAATAA
jgi:hypothetical protein